MQTLFKFLRTGMRSQHEDFQWEIGKWCKVDTLKICHSGFHGSRSPLDALAYVSGEIVAIAEVRGQSVIESDKEAWSEMRIVAAMPWGKSDSVALAIYSAGLVIQPRKAIEAAWIDDPATTANAAADAAYTAAADAVCTAARTAARATTYADAYTAYTAACAGVRGKINDWMLNRISLLPEIDYAHA